jgi:23S rRNA pseudouridine955/2504/2580 synthase
MPIDSHRILFQDDHFLAVNKRSGELVVRGSGKTEKLPLFDFLKRGIPELQVLHRLDFETSGIVVFAKTKAIQAVILNTKFDQWKKLYKALVMGRFDRSSGVIRHSLPSRESKEMIPAKTRYRVIERFANSSFVEAEIETGRRHQIRQHFAKIEHPLALDQVYGHEKFNRLFTHELGYRKFFLHASGLSFPHPITGETVSIEAPVPRAFEEVLARLRELS